MKFFVFFFLCCVALAAAAPSLIAWPGLVGPGIVAPGLVAPGLVAPALGPRTIVQGPTVVNNVDPLGARIVAPGIIGVI